MTGSERIREALENGEMGEKGQGRDLQLFLKKEVRGTLRLPGQRLRILRDNN